jgi:vacuolar protein-sorting-associated protein 4
MNQNDNSVVNNEEENKLKQQILQTKLNNSPNVKWSDIIGLDKVKKILIDTIMLPIELPQVFIGNRKPVKSILLYGPPGTGKTNLAKAVATNSGQSFYAVTSADLISKYVGESEKNIKALFDIIKNDKPCILFIDEIDSLCSKRGEGDSSSSNTKSVQQFLIQLDGIGEINMDGVLLLGATNLPWILDMGMRRRFEKKIYIPLPDEKTRELMLKYYISKNEYLITNEEFNLLSKKTNNYSGSDIDTLCKAASRLPMDMILDATHFEISSNNIHIRPCSPNHPNAMKLNYIDVRDKTKIIPPPITSIHISMALKDVKSSVDIRDLEKYDAWTKEFGQY